MSHPSVTEEANPNEIRGDFPWCLVVEVSLTGDFPSLDELGDAEISPETTGGTGREGDDRYPQIYP